VPSLKSRISRALLSSGNCKVINVVKLFLISAQVSKGAYWGNYTSQQAWTDFFAANMGKGWNLRFQRKRRKQGAVLVSREGKHYDF
jgi:hypothetical protein